MAAGACVAVRLCVEKPFWALNDFNKGQCHSILIVVDDSDSCRRVVSFTSQGGELEYPGWTQERVAR